MKPKTLLTSIFLLGVSVIISALAMLFIYGLERCGIMAPIQFTPFMPFLTEYENVILLVVLVMSVIYGIVLAAWFLGLKRHFHLRLR